MGVRVTDIVKEFNLKVISQGPGDEEINLIETNRSGLQLSGFYDLFEEKRIQIIGNAENAYLQSRTSEDRDRSLETLVSRRVPCIIVTNDLTVSENIQNMGRHHDRWILSTPGPTSRFLVGVTLYLQSELAESITQHGDLVDVYGVGVLITGDSGIGKSETALDLIRNGHLLVADDALLIKKIGQDVLIGTSSELTKNLMELRGIGIININSLFGKRAIRIQKNIEIVMNLEKWDDTAYYDRVGDTFDTTKILDVELPFIRIPVKPGRNIAAIIEVAALNYRQNLMGYNAARELSNTIKKLSQ
jgi:HPr kinase/phosphorylase